MIRLPKKMNNIINAASFPAEKKARIDHIQAIHSMDSGRYRTQEIIFAIMAGASALAMIYTHGSEISYVGSLLGNADPNLNTFSDKFINGWKDWFIGDLLRRGQSLGGFLKTMFTPHDLYQGLAHAGFGIFSSALVVKLIQAAKAKRQARKEIKAVVKS